MNEHQKASPITTIAVLLILLAVIIVAGAYIKSPEPREPLGQKNKQEQPAIKEIPMVTNDDHIRGSINAPIKIVEYSDLECPFCKQFHFTMKSIMNDYEASGKVAWVFRHYPIDDLHKKARQEATATECAGTIGGNKGFWNYLSSLYELTPSNDGLDLNLLPKIATDVGLNAQAFVTCLESSQHEETINREIIEAQAAGAQGTPFPVIIGPDGSQTQLGGAVSYQILKARIESLLLNYSDQTKTN